MPFVSVVIPLYNKEPHISQALDSVLSQTFQEFEVIIIDDGSTDKSAEIVKNFTDPKIRLIQQENAGVSAARNRGIEKAKADLIAFLDADDEWTPSFLETILRLREKYPEAGAFSTAYKICHQNGKMIDTNYKSIPKPPWEGLLESYFLTVTRDFPLSTSAVAVPKKILIEMGGFKKEYWWGEDADMWGRIALKYPVAFSSQVASVYYRNSINRACLKNIPIKEHPFVEAGKMSIKCGIVPNKIKIDLSEYIAYLEIATSRNNLRAKRRKDALRILKSCKTNRYFQKKILMIFLALMPHTLFKYIYIKAGKLRETF
ncbi:glycosyltransferase family 2 protein [Methanosarcina mazei]|uniref:Putative glycosyl transferase n=1 Tax=Methanosarcina mazei SarPi TaxID=1434115 RepID=A0A0E3R5T8_METMZ|nr:glycosyltransferase family 2 protein [Methanosarcina mazei]AKB60120.1 putative glycosyl transferase [Methanosarcina mazei SarPi]